MTDNATPDPRLLTFVDAMCSWCYGFTPELEKVRVHYSGRLDHYTFSGGLRPYNTEPLSAEMRRKLISTYDLIRDTTGRNFNVDAVLEPGFIYDTEPASRAIVTMRFLKPGMDYSFYLTLQNAFYAHGEDITKPEILAAYADKFDVPFEEFLQAFDSEQIREATRGDFQVAANFGIDGFPTLVLHRLDTKNPNALMLISRGFANAQDIIERIDAALAADV